MEKDIINFINRRVDLDILARTHAFKVSALARRLAYEFTQTPAAKSYSIRYYEALELIEPRLISLHAKVRAERR